MSEENRPKYDYFWVGGDAALNDLEKALTGECQILRGEMNLPDEPFIVEAKR